MGAAPAMRRRRRPLGAVEAMRSKAFQVSCVVAERAYREEAERAYREESTTQFNSRLRFAWALPYLTFEGCISL